MVLVDADAVEAHLVGVLERVDVLVVELMADAAGHKDRVGISTHTLWYFSREVIGQVTIRHQMEPGELHRSSLGGC